MGLPPGWGVVVRVSPSRGREGIQSLAHCECRGAGKAPGRDRKLKAVAGLSHLFAFSSILLWKISNIRKSEKTRTMDTALPTTQTLPLTFECICPITYFCFSSTNFLLSESLFNF